MSVAGRTTLGRPRSRQAEVEVSGAPHGVCADWLVQTDDPADAGAPLARPYPEVSQ